MRIGAKIRAVRKARGMTLAQVASRLGITAAGLSLIERDERNVTVHLLEQIALVLKTDVRDFFLPDINETLTDRRSSVAV